MKKLVVSFVFLVVGICASAHDLMFFNIDEVKQLNETQFLVRSGAQKLRVNPDVYSKVKSNINDYLLVTYTDAKQSAITVAKKSNIQYRVLGVDSVGISEDGLSMVFLSSGSVYKSANKAWLTVRPGQKVAGAFVDGETKIITRRWHTVPRETAVTTEIPVSPAPTAPVIVLDEENKVMAAAPAPIAIAKAPAPAPTATQFLNGDDDDEEEGLMTEFPKKEAAAAEAAEAARKAAAEEAARKAAEAKAAEAARKAAPTTSQPKTVRLVRTSK